jgi:hypothetical protein
MSDSKPMLTVCSPDARYDDRLRRRIRIPKDGIQGNRRRAQLRFQPARWESGRRDFLLQGPEAGIVDTLRLLYIFV